MAKRKKLRRNPPIANDMVRPEGSKNEPPNIFNGSQVRIEILGKEMIEKRVNASASSGRVYLPPEWVGHKVRIIRID